MPVAALLTLLALVGVVLGALGHSRVPSSHLATGGGGLLVGICVFWVLPEIAEDAGWMRAIVYVVVVAIVLLLIDRALAHSDYGTHHSLVLPLLTAAALHSFLDGWSLRALASEPLANVAVPLGLGLHKIPEGLALGWISRKTLHRTAPAIAIASAVELFTLLGAWVEPYAERSGLRAFGGTWTAAVLAIVGGSFLFLGLHAVLPSHEHGAKTARSRTGLLVFPAMFALVGLLSLLRR